MLLINGKCSKYKGVSKNGNRWQVLIMINRKRTVIENFDSEEEVSKSYNKYTIKYQGKNTRIIFFMKDSLFKIINFFIIKCFFFQMIFYCLWKVIF